MANRIVATFSPEDVKAMGPRFSGIREAMTPLMNALAGEDVFWTQNSDGAWLVLASSKATVKKLMVGDRVRGPWGISDAEVLAIDGDVAWLRTGLDSRIEVPLSLLAAARPELERYSPSRPGDWKAY